MPERARVVMSPAEVRRRMHALTEHVSAEDYKRLDKLLGAFPNEPHGRARLSDCLAAVRTGKGEDQLASFRAFRLRLAHGAKAAGLGWTLVVDSKKRSRPADRECWFLAPPEDMAAESVAELSRQETAVLRDQPFVPQRGVPAMGRRLVRFFVSFDDKDDAKRAASLLADLEASFRGSSNYEYEVWHQGKILAGEIKGREIEEALDRSDFGLLLLSVHRLAGSGADVDLSELVESARPLIPVALGKLSDRYDLHGLEAHQIFKSKRGSFSECRDAAQKAAFVEELFEEIERRLDRWVEETERKPIQPQRSRARLAAYGSGRFDENMARELMSSYAPDPEALSAFVHSSGAEASLAEDLDRSESDRSEARAVDMLDALQRWVMDPDGTRYAAILGEYGMGKTTLLRKLTDELLRQRVSDPSVPLPIFIDLRYYSETIQKEARVPRNIEALLGEALDRAWRSARPEVDPEDILRLVREEGAILMFDGLDEKLVHLTEAQGQAFIRTLWQALPPRSSDAQQTDAASAERDPRSASVSGRLIFSCRSHYFKTLRSQSALFLGEDREGVRSTSYRAWVLLSFNERQIRLYLANVLGEARVDAAMELFGAVHNLRDLAQRPYLLSLIAQHIDALERKRMRGETVRGVTIYNLLVERWLERDNGKHKLRPEDKLRLMEEVAGTMWAQGDRAWPWEPLRDWLGARLAGDDVFRTRYASVAPEVLEEDIRTATFILRPDASEREFRFAHTSLLEFFLAKHLFRALASGATEPWAGRFNPSPEAFDFLGQLILSETDARIRDTCLATMSALLSGNHPDAAAAAFRYWVVAIQRGLPVPRPPRVDLRGADLSNLAVRGRSATERLNLSRADLSGATLVGSVWQDVDLSAASLAGARVERGEFHRVLAREIDVSRADLTGAIWRGCDARGLRGGEAAEWYGCSWIDSLIDLESLPPRFGRLGTVSSGPACTSGIPGFEPPGEIVRRVVLGTVSGHGSLVSACAWSPDGTQLLSGSWDETLKVWDARTGQGLRTLARHGDSVTACAWSPDGTQLLSGSEDKTLKVWDARTGQELRTLAGHGASVTACAWSPDGTQLLSGSGDKTLKVWDARTGQELRTLAGHGAVVTACAWSPDGTQLLSSSRDNTLKVWDARTGSVSLTLAHLPQRESAALDLANNRVVWASPGAWRYLGWQFYDEDAGRLRLLPAEHFGPLPG
ncbi:MAG: pentapeptide repeat-containing protein [Thermoanaerobaculia bacterium]